MATGDLEHYQSRFAQEVERAASAPDEHLRSLHMTYAELLRAKIDAITSEARAHAPVQTVRAAVNRDQR